MKKNCEPAPGDGVSVESLTWIPWYAGLWNVNENICFSIHVEIVLQRTKFGALGQRIKLIVFFTNPMDTNF